MPTRGVGNVELTFLGTGAGLPSKERNVTSQALELSEMGLGTWLFDCGEGTQHQILQTSIKPRKIEKIFITHLHGDHIFGLPGLLSSRSFQDGVTPVTIYGPTGIAEYVQTSLAISSSHLNYPLLFEEFKKECFFDFGQVTVRAKLLDHGIDSFGYRIEEKDQIGELNVSKLKTLGVQPGPIYKVIKQHPKTTLPSGEVIERKHVVGPNRKGRVVTIMGDTRYPEKHADFVQSSDLLVHEATFSSRDQDIATLYYHSSISEVAKVAKSAHVKRLVLTHISQRYLLKDLKELEDEARLHHPNASIAKDFDREKIAKP